MKLLLKLYYSDKKSNHALLIISTYCLILLLFRAKMTQTIFLFFVIWNLILAAIPYAITTYIKMRPMPKIRKFVLLIVWLAFLPNSFYIITDLVHLSKATGIMVWFDMLLLVSCAFVGFVLGLLSLSEFEKITATFLSPDKIKILIPTLCLLCGIGIYLGRILRYNSWEILSNPLQLYIDMLGLFLSREAILFSIHFGIFIYLFHLLRKFLLQNNH